MVTVIPLLSADQAAGYLARAGGLEFEDGAASARGGSRAVKSNSQAARSHEGYDVLTGELLAVLRASPVLRDVAFPRTYCRPLVNRYGVGDHYGLHVDGALLPSGGTSVRTDLSYTLFLSAPGDYTGGALRLGIGGSAGEYRLAAGSLLVYPTHLLHEVTAVTSGERIAMVGWIESWIADPHYRELMTKLRQVTAAVEAGQVTPVTKLIAGEVAEALVRYGSR